MRYDILDDAIAKSNVRVGAGLSTLAARQPMMALTAAAAAAVPNPKPAVNVDRQAAAKLGRGSPMLSGALTTKGSKISPPTVSAPPGPPSPSSSPAQQSPPRAVLQNSRPVMTMTAVSPPPPAAMTTASFTGRGELARAARGASPSRNQSVTAPPKRPTVSATQLRQTAFDQATQATIHAQASINATNAGDHIAAANHASAANAFNAASAANSQAAAQQSSGGAMPSPQGRSGTAASRYGMSNNAPRATAKGKTMGEYRPTGKRTYCPFVSNGTIAGGAQQDIIVRPQLLFRADEFIVDATTAASFDLVAIKIGVVPQATAGGNVSCANFPAQNGPKFGFDIADQGTDITVTVMNTTTVAATFKGMLVGDEVYLAAS